MGSLIVAEERKLSGRKVRKMGYVPGVIYGPGVKNSMNVQFSQKDMNRFLNEHTTGSKATVMVNGNKHLCVIKEIQYGLINREPIHIDFYASSENSVVKVTVPFKFVGREKLGSNRLVLNILEDEIEIQGALKDLPEFIDIDVSEMTDGSEITMGDIKLPAGVKLLSKKDEIVAKVVKAEAGPEAEAESEAAAAGTQETAEAKETA
ncbi:5S rRNA E-loop-binding protein [Thermoclostridium stercorarium subsp. thermolacticum DSM 2910]|jgi:large subunit ribosomal protein L25|uniref:Large ribosomal subunit protein bL25 n=2 Tax=Thermoclostridium stercorarium TaxID=1510 RepID=A0A1B1YH97_THEST|nr:50S ribosomal protein L25 [Thermoclostridium stercorarium]ANW97586.1 5S rRNA E-loop-binding protein [Thermoclostridium stercorarium subsp. thermolacticum DSM 2910]ANX00145.1 5S rRNA E-loop-binding protein [Thermoclostridium stercorarium subsp. leptospartum DSM 9219]UZQ85703.1 50S ribosomal protein L25 [Thermoclostridium stercorarium]